MKNKTKFKKGSFKYTYKINSKQFYKKKFCFLHKEFKI